MEDGDVVTSKPMLAFILFNAKKVIDGTAGFGTKVKGVPTSDGDKYARFTANVQQKVC